MADDFGRQLADLLYGSEPTPESPQDQRRISQLFDRERLRRLAGAGEAAATIGTGLLSSIPAGYAGLSALMPTRAGSQGDLREAAKRIQDVQGALTFVPRTEYGTEYLEGFAKALEPLSVPAKYIGDITQRVTGSPTAAGVAETLADPINLVGTGIPSQMMKTGIRAAKAAPRVAGEVIGSIGTGPLPGSREAQRGAIKMKGGNWLAGEVEGATEPLKRPAVPQELTDEFGASAGVTGQEALNNWIDKKLNRYIKNEMATPEDPVRKLAEQGILHYEPRTGRVDEVNARLHRSTTGGKKLAKNLLADQWEDLADAAIDPLPAEFFATERYIAQNPWLAKVDPSAMVYSPQTTVLDRAGFDHLIDELKNSIRPDSDLPAHLRWKPEDLEKVTMEQAVRRVHDINQYRAAKKAEANEVLARNPATFTFKEYPTVPGSDKPNEKGLMWKEIKAPDMPTQLPEGWEMLEPKGDLIRASSPDGATVIGDDIPNLIKNIYKRHPETPGNPRTALEEALKYEGDVMGHCVGGYCDDVLLGRSKIYSLRDKKGEPHVTIEVEQIPRRGFREGEGPKTPEEQFDLQTEWLNGVESGRIGQDVTFAEWWRSKNGIPEPGPEFQITQIKGKANRAPKEEYLPFVQDFVRNGNWSRVGDFQNTGLRDIDRTPKLKDWLRSKNIETPKYLTEQEYGKYEADFLLDQLGKKEGGSVRISDNPDTMRLELAGGGKVGEERDWRSKISGGGIRGAITRGFLGIDPSEDMTPTEREFYENTARASAPALGLAAAPAVIVKGAKGAKAAKPAYPQAEALERARQNAVKMLNLPENNTPEMRAQAMGYIDYLHGTQRLDRLLEGKTLDPRRATSGPMPYGTTTPELASSYATSKADTSRRATDEGDVRRYFEVAPKDIGLKGMRSPLPVETAWYFMTPEQQAKIRELAPRVGYENLDEFTGKLMVHPEGVNATLSPDQWNWFMKNEAKGNPLTALRHMWYESGQLVDEPETLGQIYRLAGVNAPISQTKAPWTEAQGVLLGKARITNPIDTSNTEQVSALIEPLKQAFAKDRTKTKAAGPDQWAKDVRYTPRSWVSELEKDLAEGKESYVWTSIPDKVTAELRRLGFNGIIDRSGKGGGAKEPVVIPFDPAQVRSRFAAFDPAEMDAPDLLKATGGAIKAALAAAREKAALMAKARKELEMEQASKEYFERPAGYGSREKVNERAALIKAKESGVLPAAERDANLARMLEQSAVKNRMYHGTSADISNFRPKTGDAIFLSPDPDFASKFALDDMLYGASTPSAGSVKSGANVMPVYAQTSKPFDYENPKHIRAVLSNLDPKDRKSFKEGAAKGSWQELEKHLGSIEDSGFDSVFLSEMGRKNLAVFDPRKIKSAIGNRGTFDVTNPDITKKRGGKVSVTNNLDTMRLAVQKRK